MKKIISKILIILIIIVMLFEFTCSSPICHAAGNPLDIESFFDRATSLMGGVIAYKFWFFRIQATAVIATFWEVCTLWLAETCGISQDTFFDWSAGQLMTPFDIFFNKYNILDVNFFNIKEAGFWETIWNDIGQDNIIKNLRISVASWYYLFRNIAGIILLCVLIYVGIRMAISSVAEEKAKYQKMLYDWVCSAILIFVLQYIIIFTIEANNAIIKFIRDSLIVRTEIAGFDFVPGTYTSMDAIIGKMALQATLGLGMGSFTAIIALTMICFQTLAFFFAYMNRVLKVAFLIIISPLISITYSIDKIGDGKAQALNSWLKEFVYTILIQPFHAILYMAFANTAMALLDSTNPFIGALTNLVGGSYNEIVNAVLVILCLKFVADGEKIVRKIFNFQDDSSKTSLVAGAAVGLAGLNLMKKSANIGMKAAGVVNKFGGAPARWAKALKAVEQLDKVKEKFDETPLGRAMKTEAFQNKIKAIGDKVKELKESKIAQFAKRRIEGAKKLKDSKFVKKAGVPLKKLREIAKSQKFQKYLPYTLAMMGAAMSYSTGASGAMQAIGMGNAFKKGADGYFSASGNSIANDSKDQIMQDALANNADYQNCQEQIGKKEYELEQTKRKEALREQLDNLEQAKQSTSPEVVEAAEREEERLKKENADIYENLETREELEKKRASLTDELESLESKKEKIEEEVAKKVKNLKPEDLRVLMQNLDYLSGKVSKAKKDILKKIEQAMIEQKMLADNVDPKDPTISHEDYQLTEEEKKEAQRIQKHMMTLIDREVKGEGAEFNSTKHALDLFGTSGSGAEAVKAALESYRSAKRGAEFTAGRDNHQKYGGEEEHLRQLIIEKITGQSCDLGDCFDQESDWEPNRVDRVYEQLNLKKGEN